MASFGAAGRKTGLIDIGLRFGIVALTLTTAYIHFTLGGVLFLTNAAGYAVLAVAMVIPFGIIARYRWLVRPTLAVYATTTIFAYLVMGPYFTLGFIAKAIELALVALLVIEMFRYDGGPLAVARRAFGEVADLSRRPLRPQGA